MKLHHLIAIAAATCFAGVASAQTPPVGQPSQSTTMPGSSPDTSGLTGSSSMAGDAGGFGKLDRDRDGNISKKEAASNKDLTKQWDQLDANKDGKLDQGEFAQFEASGSASGSTSGASSSSRSSASTGKSPPPSSDKERPKY